jgi:integrase
MGQSTGLVKIAKPYPHLYRDKDRQGCERWRLRVPRRKTVTIKGAYGSPEFAANYKAAIEGAPVEKQGLVTKHGTMAALGRSYLRSAAFAALSPATQRARRYLIEQFIAKFGPLPVAGREYGFQRNHVKKIMDDHASTPGVARNVLSMLRILMALAIEEGIRDDDPTVGIKRPKLSKEGWHTWTEAEIAQYEARHPIGSQARLAFALALNTCQRAADLIRMGKQHVSDGRIAVRQQKTGTALKIRINQDLIAIIDATPSDHLTFLVSELGKPYTSANSFGQRIRKWAREAGLTGCPLHGLRKACCRRMAEAGNSASDIMAVSGHKSLAECERCVKDAEQALRADRAIARTESYPRADRSYPQEKKSR